MPLTLFIEGNVVCKDTVNWEFDILEVNLDNIEWLQGINIDEDLWVSMGKIDWKLHMLNNETWEATKQWYYWLIFETN